MRGRANSRARYSSSQRAASLWPGSGIHDEGCNRHSRMPRWTAGRRSPVRRRRQDYDAGLYQKVLTTDKGKMGPFPWALKLVIVSCAAEAVFPVWAWAYSRALARRRLGGESIDPALELRRGRWLSVAMTLFRYASMIAINVAGLREGAMLIVPS